MATTHKKVRWERPGTGLLGSIKDTQSAWLTLAKRAPILSEEELDSSVSEILRAARATDDVWAPLEVLLELAAKYEDDPHLRDFLNDFIERYAVQADLVKENRPQPNDPNETASLGEPSARTQIIATAIHKNARIEAVRNRSILRDCWALIAKPLDRERAILDAEKSYTKIQARIQEFPDDRRLWEVFDIATMMMLEIWAQLIESEPEEARYSKIISKLEEAKGLFSRLPIPAIASKATTATTLGEVEEYQLIRYSSTPRPSGGEVGVRENVGSDDQILDALKERGVSDELRRQVAAALTVSGQKLGPTGRPGKIRRACGTSAHRDF